MKHAANEACERRVNDLDVPTLVDYIMQDKSSARHRIIRWSCDIHLARPVGGHGFVAYETNEGAEQWGREEVWLRSFFVEEYRLRSLSVKLIKRFLFSFSVLRSCCNCWTSHILFLSLSEWITLNLRIPRCLLLILPLVLPLSDTHTHECQCCHVYGVSL